LSDVSATRRGRKTSTWRRSSDSIANDNGCDGQRTHSVNLSHYANGVVKKPGAVSQAMFPGHAIDSITNGVHSRFGTCESRAKLYDCY
jgi:glucan phosphorylase